MSYPVGGRGKKAQYDTKLVRIPEPLEYQVGELKSRYYGFVDGGGDPSKPVNWIKEEGGLVEQGTDSALADVMEIVERWQEKLRGKDVKKNVRYSQASVLLSELMTVLERQGDGE